MVMLLMMMMMMMLMLMMMMMMMVMMTGEVHEERAVVGEAVQRGLDARQQEFQVVVEAGDGASRVRGPEPPAGGVIGAGLEANGAAIGSHAPRLEDVPGGIEHDAVAVEHEIIIPANLIDEHERPAMPGDMPSWVTKRSWRRPGPERPTS